MMMMPNYSVFGISRDGLNTTHICQQWLLKTGNGGVLYRLEFYNGCELIVTKSAPEPISAMQFSQTVGIFDKEFRVVHMGAANLVMESIDRDDDYYIFNCVLDYNRDKEPLGALKVMNNGKVMFRGEEVSCKAARRLFVKAQFLG